MIKLKIGEKVIDLAEQIIKKTLVFARPPHMTKEEAESDIQKNFGHQIEEAYNRGLVDGRMQQRKADRHEITDEYYSGYGFALSEVKGYIAALDALNKQHRTAEGHKREIEKDGINYAE